MKLHYMGKFNLDPDSLPQAEHKPGVVEFKEADSMKKTVRYREHRRLHNTRHSRRGGVLQNYSRCRTKIRDNHLVCGAPRLYSDNLPARAAPRPLLQKRCVSLHKSQAGHAICYRHGDDEQGQVHIYVDAPEHNFRHRPLCYRHDFPEVYIPDHVRHDLHKHGRGRLLQCFQRHTPGAEERKSIYVRHAVVLVCGEISENSINS